MRYAQLGNSPIRLSEIGLGCMSLPLDDYPACKLMIEQAIRSGINYFDTADLYNHGENESTVGSLLRPSRKDVIIATKVGNQWRADKSGWDWTPSKAYIMEAAEKSLRSLQTDYIDLYQLHGGTIDDPLDDIIEAFEKLKQQGKIRYYGVSSIRPNVIKEYVMRSEIVSVMLQYNLADRRGEEEILPMLKDNKISALVRGALAQGMLVDKPAKDYLGNTAAEIEKGVHAVKKIETHHPAETAIGFVLDNSAVSAAVVGCSNIHQLEQAVHTSVTHRLTGEEVEQLKAALPAKQYTEHR